MSWRAMWRGVARCADVVGALREWWCYRAMHEESASPLDRAGSAGHADTSLVWHEGGRTPTRGDALPNVARLLEQAGSGNEGAWRELVGLYAPRVFAMARSRCCDASIAEEITQGVFATVCCKLGAGEYREHGRFESWVFRITMNRVRDWARTQRRTKRLLGNRVSLDHDTMDGRGMGTRGDAGGPGSMDGARDEAALLAQALETLAEADREVIGLRHHGGLSFKQISALLGEPLGTLLARHHRAIQKLRAVMEGEELAGGQ